MISFTILPTPVGAVLIAKRDGKICTVSIRESAADLERMLDRRFPREERKRDDALLASESAVVSAAIDGGGHVAAPPLELNGTPFQQSVWMELLKIPNGATRSYAEIARAIGKPKSTRAVAQACGANPVPVLVPCHRVIRNDGSLGGYTGGIHIKRALLRAEGVTGF